MITSNLSHYGLIAITGDDAQAIVRDAKARKWLEENYEALENYNRHVEQNGAFSDKLRRF